MRSAIVALLCAAAPALGHCFDFKGIHLGKHATPHQVEDKLAIRCGVGANEVQVCNGSTTIAEEPAWLNLVIGANGIVQRIYLTLAPDAFETVAPLLTEKFGRPASIQRSVVQNRMGAKFDQLVYSWRRSGGLELTYQRYAGNLDTSSLYFGTSEDRRLLNDAGTPENERRKDL